jgi:hypothetical protein
VSNGAVTWTIPNVNVPPANAVVTSDKGGVATSDVVVTGSQSAAVQVKATISASSNSVQVGAPVSLDSTLSTGTISSRSWAITAGPAGAALSSATAAGTTFTAPAPGTYTVQLTVNGTGTGNTSTDTVTLTVSDANAAPVADAGPDQTGIVPTSTVTLDGTNSKFAKTFSWTAPAGVTLTGPTTANPTFVMPATTTPTTYVFTLNITDVNGTPASDTVSVTNAPGKVTIDQGGASYRAGSLEWRIRGTAQYCSANNLLTFVWNKPDGTKATIGTTTPTAALGVCSYDFRAKNVATNLRPTTAGTVTVTSAMGGLVTGPFSLL